VVVVSLNASRVILLEAGLAFLGLSDQNKMSLGFLINNAQLFLEQAWWMSVFPGLGIVVAVLGINLLADTLNDVLNPLGLEERAAT
jgi:peptide/nickel transport system permease protein